MAEVLFAVGRLIGGNLYKMFPKKKKVNGQMVVVMLRDGVTPVAQCNFGVAIPKTAGQSWSQSSWGAIVAGVAQTGFPNGEWQRPDFAWKITDGDSAVPNKSGNVPNQQIGYPGHWVIWFTQQWPPKLCNADGSITLTEPDSIVPGYYVQVLGEVIKNTGDSPGVYMNPKAVALSGYGERIASAAEVDTRTAGFGGALPAGASPVPIGAMGQLVATSPVIGVAVLPAIPVQVAPAPLTTVAPNAVYMAPPPPVAAGPRILRNAQGQQADYAQMIANKWTDALLAEHGWIG